ncbi:DeoR/GlpR family DNA-binding transcription regulator [Mycolicibacterium nivoides]|uniref:DeoR/GlpR family DNA-binding transcription regulator n=1 Tax=Mycolicibacterium nivoides TaxID=2487344 RepID=A0ABW9L1P8_9MYCO|nr:DeoR/GlpR family DNA-binding transcription regulator [Mycolicibacterium nivoides]MBN3507443.1 DeoR/GlpR transcriptional regulator [Mycolicibacterium septicum]QRY43409.1 DeoR/GlpR transcriptional regulator [Mycolicibacterium boenickei]SEQ15449.1 DNA-binding transcriptional regulator of sugar metabolism, DeoR/GlpR family [Mycobacterium sp. 88mf]SFF37460.1 DNA-binding transcriptional regulator of sugar metabolism, DeoR/GlpR family [Mycobacterium sp. 455mf]
MSVEERRALIEERLRSDGEVDFASLAAMFEVSEMTIRRDIDVLESQGAVRRVRGGAIAYSHKAEEPAFGTRVESATAEKAHIATAAVELLEPHETVIIDSGSTALAVAHQIRGRGLGLTVITPSVLAALELVDEPNTTVFLTGGRLRPGELSLIGSDAQATYRRYNCDTYIMGVAGVDAKRGLTDYHSEESDVKRAAMESADRVILAVDSSKLGRVQLINIAPLSAVNTIVTDGPQDDPVLDAARQQGIDVRVAHE